MPDRPLALPEIHILLLAASAAIVLGPLLRGAFAGLPVVPFLAAMILCMVPGFSPTDAPRLRYAL